MPLLPVDLLNIVDGLEPAWGQRLESMVTAAGLTIPERRSLISDLAWLARQERLPIPELSTGAPLTAVYYAGQRLRFDFRFIELDHVMDQRLRTFPDDAFLLGLASMAAHGLGRNDAAALVERALSRPDADTKTRHLCLHALWFSAKKEDLERAVTLGRDMVDRSEDGSNTRFRMAGVLRRLDRHDEALVEVDQALRLLGHDQPDVHQDYARERELIVATRELQAKLTASQDALEELTRRMEEQMEEATSSIDRRLVKAEDVVADGLLRTVEIIGLFVALVTFAFGTGIAAFTVTQWTDLIPLLVFLLVGSAGFLCLLRVAASWPRRQVVSDPPTPGPAGKTRRRWGNAVSDGAAQH